MLRDSVLQAAANGQEFVWRELASAVHPGPVDFDRAQLGLTRMTSHYAAGLAFSRVLVLRLTSDDFLAMGRERLAALEFNVPSIFERFMERLLGEVAATNRRLGVAFQAPDRFALMDADGNTYRSVIPDIELLVDGKPTGVIDAKFKPQYVAAHGTQKVSTADIYQAALLYQARATQRSGRVVRAAIAAAQVQADSPPDNCHAKLSGATRERQNTGFRFLLSRLGHCSSS